MLLGKRPRPPMKRTTSMSEITFDINNTNGDAPPSDLQNPFNRQRQEGGADPVDQRLLAMVSPRNHRRNSADFSDTSHFLRSCSLCKRRLVPGRDIYMYRGDTAFCSMECRQKQIAIDDRKEKCPLASASASTTASPQVSAKGETVAAL